MLLLANKKAASINAGGFFMEINTGDDAWNGGDKQRVFLQLPLCADHDFVLLPGRIQKRLLKRLELLWKISLFFK